MARLIADHLRRRARTQGAQPLVTYYDLSTSERTELSGVSFLNWVDKTSNLLVDEYLLAPGAVVDLQLARRAPGHWMTLVVEMAAWQVGAVIQVSGAEQADVLVLGPDWELHDRSRAEATIACSLHPLGLGFPGVLPPNVADFSLEVRGQSDHHSPSPRSAGETAWVDGDLRLSQADLLSAGHEQTPGRHLVRPSDPWTTVRDGLLTPLLTGGSAVLVVGDAPERLQRIVETERLEPR